MGMVCKEERATMLLYIAVGKKSPCSYITSTLLLLENSLQTGSVNYWHHIKTLKEYEYMVHIKGFIFTSSSPQNLMCLGKCLLFSP